MRELRRAGQSWADIAEAVVAAIEAEGGRQAIDDFQRAVLGACWRKALLSRNAADAMDGVTAYAFSGPAPVTGHAGPFILPPPVYMNSGPERIAALPAPEVTIDRWPLPVFARPLSEIPTVCVHGPMCMVPGCPGDGT